MFEEISAASYVRQIAKQKADSARLSFSNEDEVKRYQRQVRNNIIGRVDDDYREWMESIAMKEWEFLHQNIANALSWSELPTFVRADFIAVVKTKLEERTKGM